MYHCLYYWLIAPIRGGVNDSPARQPAWTVPIQLEPIGSFELSLYLDEQGLPQFARLRIPDLEKEAIPENLAPFLLAVGEHILSVLRVTFSPDTRFAQPRSIYSFVKEGSAHDVRLLIDLYESNSFNAEPAKHFFVQSFDLREHLRLYLDGCDEHIPVQYQFLSLYKLLEIIYRPLGQWRKHELKALLEPFASQLVDKHSATDPAALLHELRDKCAHGRVGKSADREERGVSYLNAKQLARVERAMPALRDACAMSLNKLAVGKFQVGRNVQEKNRADPGDA